MSCDPKQHCLLGQEFNSFIKTVDGVLMFPNLLQELAYLFFRPIQIQFDFVRHPFFRFNGDVQRYNLRLKTVDLLLLSESVEACADCASVVLSSVCSLYMFHEFRVPLGIRIVSQSDYLQILFRITIFQFQSLNFAFEALSVTFVFRLSVLGVRHCGGQLSFSITDNLSS